MRYALSVTEVQDMWLSVSDRVFKHFNYEKPHPLFAVARHELDFMAWTEFMNQETWEVHPDLAYAVGVDDLWREFMYEDEMEATLIHEAVHVVCGLGSAFHDATWAQMTAEVGGWAESEFTIRKVADVATILGVPFNPSIIPSLGYLDLGAS